MIPAGEQSRSVIPPSVQWKFAFLHFVTSWHAPHAKAIAFLSLCLWCPMLNPTGTPTESTQSVLDGWSVCILQEIKSTPVNSCHGKASQTSLQPVAACPYGLFSCPSLLSLSLASPLSFLSLIGIVFIVAAVCQLVHHARNRPCWCDIHLVGGSFLWPFIALLDVCSPNSFPATLSRQMWTSLQSH